MPRPPMTADDLLAVSRRCAAALAETMNGSGDDASTAALVAASGVSERTFFRCFPTKAECIRPVLEYGYRRFVAEVAERCTHASGAADPSDPSDASDAVEAAPAAARRDLLTTAQSALESAFSDDVSAGLGLDFVRVLLGHPGYRRIWLEINEDTAAALVPPVAVALGLSHDHLDVRIAADEITLLAVTTVREMVRTGCPATQIVSQVAESIRRQPIARDILRADS